jgi:hypothetical protein
LTRSPVAAVLEQARQMARRHLQAGGNVASARGHLDDHFADDFVLPPGADPAEVASTIEVKRAVVVRSPSAAAAPWCGACARGSLINCAVLSPHGH